MTLSSPTDDHALPLVSVIIPTYNRKESLLRALESLSRQTYPANHFEVIVVDDGGSDGTEDALRTASYPFPLRYLRQPHLGVGAGRQLGLDEAAGALLLYLDDDMVCEPAVIAEHVATHAMHPKAVVKGQVILILDDPDSVFASLHTGTPDLPLSHDHRPSRVSFQQVFAGHFSICRSDALAVGGWPDEPRGYGFQDLEFMHRCSSEGLQLLFFPTAVSYHYDHATTLSRVCHRIERASYSAATHLFIQRPELRGQIAMFRDKGPIAWRQDPPALVLRKLARQVASSRPAMWVMERAVPLLEGRAPRSKLLALFYRWIISGHIYRGYRNGLREQGISA